VHASNVTPDMQTGIGSWSADDCWRAMHDRRAMHGERASHQRRGVVIISKATKSI
jgi:hypothetical protein